MLNKKQIRYVVAITSWSLLGFYRGVKDIDYWYRHIERKKNNDKPYLYSKAIINSVSKNLGGGVYGVIIYINPVLFFVTIPKELYRLEVCVRGLEDEKKTDYYNRIF